MPTGGVKKTQKKVRSLAAKPVPAERAGKVKAGITVSKRTDTSSADLFLKCANGKHYD